MEGQGAPFCRILRLKNYGVLENRESDRLEPKAEENRRRMDMLVCGCGFVCPVGGGCVVGARNELLHWGVLPNRSASSSKKARVAAF